MKVISIGFLFSIGTLAADSFLVKKGTEQVSAARLELTTAIKDLNSGVSAVDLSKKLIQVQRRLVAAERSLIESVNGGGNYPSDPVTPDYPNHPGYGRGEMSAKCEIDDDPDFTPGQMSGGNLKGSSIQALIAECDAIARASGSTNYSSGISDIKIVYKPKDYVQATCEIDDDPDFTTGQFLVGEIIGRNFSEISTGCRSIAKAAYGEKGSAGIKNPKIDATAFRVTADCHLDDDPDFTSDQVVFGKIGGASVAEIVNQCATIARETYGDKGSSGLRNVVQR